MNIKARINARKIVLSYLYQHCFFVNLLLEDKMLTESLFIDYIFKTDKGMYDKEKEKLKEEIKTHMTIYTIEDFKEFIDCFFDQRLIEDIDFDYITKVGINFTKYIDEVSQKVNKYAQTFQYIQMDPLDQAIFLLGYVEWKELETPKEVLLNEMIELAKRYSDEGAPKLLNGIMHKIVNEEN
ncbi:MAG: transcription antitermination factor NusB [Candidatus Absconditabacterales bacterium]